MDSKEIGYTALKEALVENFTSTALLKQMLLKDTLCQVLFSLPQLQHIVADTFKDQLCEKSQALIEYAIYCHSDRQREVDAFTAYLEEIIEENTGEGKKYVAKFFNIKMKIVDTISNLDYNDLVSRIKLDSAIEDFIHQLDCLWEVLMKLETELLSKIEEMTYKFKSIMKKKLMEFLEYSRSVIEEIQDLDKNLFDRLFDFCIKELTGTDLKKSTLHVALTQMLKSEQTLNAALNESHQKHLDALSSQEKLLTSRAASWLADLVNRLNQRELQRNRHRVMEINRFLDLQKDSLDNLGASVTLKLLNNA